MRVAAYRFGGEGPPLVLVHATGFHAHVWLPLVPVLSERFTVLAFDLRGHGESEVPAGDEAFAWERFGDDVLAVAAHFGARRFHAMGHSAGGAAVIIAELARPGSVERAVLFEPIVYPSEVTSPSPAIAAARRRRTVFASTAQMLAAWSSRPPFASLDPEALRCYVEYGVRGRADGQVELKCAPETEVRTFSGDVHAGIWERLGRYAPPTLVMTGRRDEHRRSQYAEALAGAMRDGRAERRLEHGHFLPFERPREMAERAARFLAAGG